MTSLISPSTAIQDSNSSHGIPHMNKLSTLLLLVLVASSALGATVWLGIGRGTVDSTHVVSSYQILSDTGGPDRRVVGFDNLIMWRGQLHYLYTGSQPEVPQITVNWHQGNSFAVSMLHTSKIPDEMKMTKVEVIKAASLTWRQWHGNLYHGLGEAVYEIFNCACKYLEHCGGEDGSELSPIFIETTGDDTQWADALPAAESVLRCLFPGPDYSLGDKAIHDRVFLIKRSAAGIGPYNRKWRGFPDQATNFKNTYGTVDRDVSLKYRQRLVQCFDLQYPSLLDAVADGPFEVTIINREYDKGRHMVNSGEIARRMLKLPLVRSTRTVYLEPLTVQQQFETFASSQVLLMTHGAALVNLLFMPEGSVVIIYNWLQRETLSPHTWVTDYMDDLHLPVNFVGLSTKDRRYISPIKERYVFLPEYDRLAAEDKIKLLEQGCCPPAGLPGCSDMVLNFAIDWELLHPALQVAFDDMTQRHVLSRTVLDT